MEASRMAKRGRCRLLDRSEVQNAPQLCVLAVKWLGINEGARDRIAFEGSLNLPQFAIGKHIHKGGVCWQQKDGDEGEP
jgi:hypothetical protein